ncbi:hypothetical protein HN415_10100 [Candidatus Woesearchaeota archaeon]|jgi:hypothetical protein|nr:hypothetical protein [Candidatus Woesearchaeota archaeon]
MENKELTFKNLVTENQIKSNIENSIFSPWKNYILDTLKNSDTNNQITKHGNKYTTLDDIRYYRINPASKLLKKANQHKKKYSKSLENNEILALIHPFFRNLYDKSEYKNKKLKKINNYINQIDFVCKNIDSNIDIILVDTLHSYTGCTHKLLESGHFKDVFFSFHNQGYLIDESNLNILKNKDIYLAGGYNGYCLFNFSYELVTQNFKKNKLKFVNNLIYSDSDNMNEMNKTKKIKNPFDSTKFMPKKYLINSRLLCN